MACEEHQETILEFATDSKTRSRIAEALAHVQRCRHCQVALAEFDRITCSLQDQAESPESSVKPQGGWEAFDQRMAELGDRHQSPQRMVRWSSPTFGIAAALICAVGAFWFGQRSTLSSQISQLSTARPKVTSLAREDAMFAIDRSEMVHATKAFARISKECDGRAGWMLVSDSSTAASGSLDMGLSPTVMDVDHAVDVLRLTMLRGTEVVSKVDLVIVPGQAADLTVMLSPGQSVHYRAGTFTADHPRLNLLAEINSPSGDHSVATLSTSLDLQPDGQVNAGELQTSSGRYELWCGFSRTTLPAHQ